MGETRKEILNEKKLWIGNLDPRVTEYQLLKLVQSYGKIEKFDLIFHRTGPLCGQPRGYAFVSFTKKEDAKKAKLILNGKLLGQKKITVTWAHSTELDTVHIAKVKNDIKIPALALSKDTTKTDAVLQIQAIEAKLKLMEQKKEDELKINDSIATKPPVIQQYQFNKDKCSGLKTRQSSRSYRHESPYSNYKIQI